MSYSINKTKFLTETELKSLRELITREDSRDSLMLRLALATGARAQELLNIQTNDLNDDDMSVLIRGLKNSDDREIPLRPELYKLIRGHSRPNERLFKISYRRLVQIWELYRPTKKKFHSLRHTFAIELYKKTRDLRVVQVALGHKSINNTMVYAQYVYKTNELRKLIL